MRLGRSLALPRFTARRWPRPPEGGTRRDSRGRGVEEPDGTELSACGGPQSAARHSSASGTHSCSRPTRSQDQGLEEITLQIYCLSADKPCRCFFAASVRDQTPKLRLFRPRCWAQCIRISPEFSRCHCPTRYRSFRTCGIVFPTPVNRCPSPNGNAVNWISIEDLAEVRRWDEERAVGLGDRFLSQAEDCIRRIQAFPDLYEQVCQGYRRAIVRRFPVWSSMNTPQMGLSSARFFILLRIQKSVGNVCSDRCGKVFEIP